MRQGYLYSPRALNPDRFWLNTVRNGSGLSTWLQNVNASANFSMDNLSQAVRTLSEALSKTGVNLDEVTDAYWTDPENTEIADIADSCIEDAEERDEGAEELDKYLLSLKAGCVRN